MKRRLVLHVGMHKTGTSSIQQTLSRGAAVLREAGWLYPDVAVNHSEIMHSAFAEPSKAVSFRGHRMSGRTEEADIVRFNRRNLDALTVAIEAAPEASVLISGEGMSRLDAAGAERLLAWGRAHFSGVEVVVFVRPPASATHSKVQQHVKGGKSLNWLRQAELSTNYRFAIEKFKERLPPDALHLRVFARDALVSNCSVATLLDCLGLVESVYSKLAVVRANEAISTLAADLLFAASATIPAMQAGAPNPARAGTLRGVLQATAGPRFWAPAALIERSVAAAADDIAWLNALLGQDIRDHEPGLPADAVLYNPDIPPARWAELGAIVTAVNAGLLQLEGNPGRKPSRKQGGKVAEPGAARASSGANRKAKRQERQRRLATADPGLDLADAERSQGPHRARETGPARHRGTRGDRRGRAAKAGVPGSHAEPPYAGDRRPERPGRAAAHALRERADPDLTGREDQ